MNVTVATEMVRERFNLSHDEMAQAASSVPAGNDGLMLIPFFEGERTPNVPDGTGVYFGLRDKTFSIGHFARAAMEGTTLGLNYGLNRLRELGVTRARFAPRAAGRRAPSGDRYWPISSTPKSSVWRMKKGRRSARQFRRCGPIANGPGDRKASKISVTVTSRSPKRHGSNLIPSASLGTRGCRKRTTASCAISRRRSRRIAASLLADFDNTQKQ